MGNKAQDNFVAGVRPFLYEVVKDGFRYITSTINGDEESIARYIRDDLLHKFIRTEAIDAEIAKALKEARAEGYAHAVENVFDKVESLSYEWGEDGCYYVDRDKALTEIRALAQTSTPPRDGV